MVSAVIPSRNEPFLQQTIDELLLRATGEIEIVVVLDGYWPDPKLKDDPRVVLVHRGVSRGMRAAINAGVAVAKGDYILKIDAHCMVGDGFDQILADNCEDDWVVVPTRHRLDPYNWVVKDDGRAPINYMYLSYPNDPNDWGGAGLHGRIWDENNKCSDLKKLEIDDLLSSQGSCWFMKKTYFDYLELMDEENFGTFAQEFQEISFKAWLSGGRVVVNKKTWYAHWHKGKDPEGKNVRNYFIDTRDLKKANEYTNRWLSEKVWHKQIHDMKWLIEKFWPVPGWPEDRELWKI